jgi:hypothetical protein
MTSVLQIKRRINGAAGSPAAAGIKEGELALNFPGAAGTTTKPALWAFDGTAWRQVNPDTTIITQSITLPAGADIGAAYTTWATTPANTITGNVVIATYGTPAQAYVLTNPAAPGTAASWTSLGGAVSFATTAEVLAGTEATKAINPLGLQSRIVTAPNATPANDANKIAVLDATGKIPAGFLPVGGLVFSGSIDPTAAVYAAPTPAPVNGQFYSITKAGAISAAWKPQFANAGLTTVAIGDYMVWDDVAKKFHHIANAVDMSAYVPLAGTALMTGAIAYSGAAGSKAGTIIYDGKGGTLDAVLLDAGTY